MAELENQHRHDLDALLNDPEYLVLEGIRDRGFVPPYTSLLKPAGKLARKGYIDIDEEATATGKLTIWEDTPPTVQGVRIVDAGSSPVDYSPGRLRDMMDYGHAAEERIMRGGRWL